LENLLADTFGFERQDLQVRVELARNMVTRPAGLILSSACAVLAGGTISAATTLPGLRAAATALVLVAAVRAALGTAKGALAGKPGRMIRLAYPLLALLFAATIGVCAALALWLPAESGVQILAVSFAMSVGAGIAVGNAARPAVVVGQMALTFAPIMVACFSIGSQPLVALGLIMPCLSMALIFVTFNVFSALGRQVRSAADNREMARQMREQARTDTVTGLHNRGGFEGFARRRLSQQSGDRVQALFWLDLHRFKAVNDTLGHHAGDEVLRRAARRLRALAPPGGVLGRFGSDEFLLLASLPDLAAAERLAAHISADLATPMRLGKQRIDGGVALGVALAEGEGRDLDRLMQHAGLALYSAKAAGRQQVRFFEPAMTSALIRRREIEDELRSAIWQDDLTIYFQPIVDLATGRIRAFEALVRWFHPERGELPPHEFIPVAEDTGLIITLGNWITRKAALAAAQWPDDVIVAVNLSPVQINAPGAALGILAALRDARLPAHRLELEVTENLFVSDNAASRLFIDQLAAAGVRFALDDFGTGYSSLHYINQFPFRTIKVDRSFVSGPNIGRASQAIIRAVAEMGTTLDMEIVAEGLETAVQVAVVREAGCTLGQGWFYSHAVPADEALRLLADQHEGLQWPLRKAG